MFDSEELDLMKPSRINRRSRVLREVREDPKYRMRVEPNKKRQKKERFKDNYMDWE